MKATRACLLLCLAALTSPPLFATESATTGSGLPRAYHPRITDPSEIEAPAWLEPRAAAQRERAAAADFFHDFRFVDRQPESNITFRGRVVPDGGTLYRAVHYDHGNGIAVADIDGDGLDDIYFVNQVGANELWRNLGGGRFENFTARAGLAVDDRISVTASFADLDNDGDADLYVTTVMDGNLLFENDGRGYFRDVSAGSGLDYVGHSSGAVLFDYDRDGLLDVFLTNVGIYSADRKIPAGLNYPEVQFPKPYTYRVGLKRAFQGHFIPERQESSRLFRNLGGNRFADVTEQVGLVDFSWSGDASAVDLNEDGWQDLYILDMQGHDEYYENVAGERFVKKSRELFPATSWGAMGIKVFDYNNDGRMDIYITDMHTDMLRTLDPADEKQKIEKRGPEKRRANTDGNHVRGNSFFRNEGGGRFVEVSDELNVENFWPWGLSVGDLNADGYQDIFVTASMNMAFRYSANNLLMNERGRGFVDSEFVLGAEPRRDGATGKPWFRIDCSGADRQSGWCQGREGQVEMREALGSRASVIFDLDADGDLDIVTNEWNWVPMVLVSDLSERRAVRYLKVRLRGERSNRDGLGARVTVTAGGRRYTQVNDGKSGYLSQSRLPLYFGLDDASAVEAVEVQWPAGTVQTVAAPITINSLLEIAEPADSARQ